MIQNILPLIFYKKNFTFFFHFQTFTFTHHPSSRVSKGVESVDRNRSTPHLFYAFKCCFPLLCCNHLPTQPICSFVSPQLAGTQFFQIFLQSKGLLSHPPCIHRLGAVLAGQRPPDSSSSAAKSSHSPRLPQLAPRHVKEGKITSPAITTSSHLQAPGMPPEYMHITPFSLGASASSETQFSILFGDCMSEFTVGFAEPSVSTMFTGPSHPPGCAVVLCARLVLCLLSLGFLSFAPKSKANHGFFSFAPKSHSAAKRRTNNSGWIWLCAAFLIVSAPAVTRASQSVMLKGICIHRLEDFGIR